MRSGFAWTPSQATSGPFASVDEACVASPDAQRRYRIQVAVPRSQVPAGGWPLVVALDGNAVFDLLRAEPALAGVPVLVAGVGYDTAVTPVAEGRAYDYTPPLPNVSDLRDPRHPERRAGGAEAFLDFIEQALLPELMSRHDVDARRLSFYGHSYGGLCVVHALCTRARPFTQWIAASPSVWWHDQFLLTEAAAAARRGVSPRQNLVLFAGGNEHLRWQPATATTPRPPGGTPTLPWAQTLADTLARMPGLSVDLRVLPQVDHRGTLLASVPMVPSLASA